MHVHTQTHTHHTRHSLPYTLAHTVVTISVAGVTKKLNKVLVMSDDDELEVFLLASLPGVCVCVCVCVCVGGGGGGEGNACRTKKVKLTITVQH